MTLQSNITCTITEAAARVCPRPLTRTAAAALALCLLLITSCSTESIESTDNTGEADNTPVPVLFDTYTTTRANTGLMTQEALQRNGFGVFAYYTEDAQWADNTDSHTPNFMYNQPVKYQSNAWQYEPIKYWPNDYSTGNVDQKQGTNGEDHAATGSRDHSYVSFFAYAPYTAVDVSSGSAVATTGITAITSNTATGAPTVNYTLPTNITTDTLVDLLWATPHTDQQKLAVNEKVKFSFLHGLAGVEVDVVRDLEDNISDDAEDTKIFVGELTMKAENAYTSGTMSLEDGSWSNQDRLGSFTYTLKGDDIDAEVRGAAYDNVAPKAGDVAGLTDAEKMKIYGDDSVTIKAIRDTELRTWSIRKGVDGTQRPLSATKLLFIPGDGAVTLTPTLKYSFVTHDDRLVLNTTLSTQLNGATWRFARLYHDNQTGGSASFTVKGGKLYKLLIHIGVMHVTFEVTSVEDWKTPEKSGIDHTESSSSETTTPQS